MKYEQINLAIAEACGKNVAICAIHHSRTCCGRQREILDYCHDLNAMHEVEDTFKVVWQLVSFGEHLSVVCANKSFTWHATARQRAEAFLRMQGLWNKQP